LLLRFLGCCRWLVVIKNHGIRLHGLVIAVHTQKNAGQQPQVRAPRLQNQRIVGLASMPKVGRPLFKIAA